ncbi:hypothetical protein Droror1_Dr00023164, partial [Drosera rotundifolia]
MKARAAFRLVGCRGGRIRARRGWGQPPASSSGSSRRQAAARGGTAASGARGKLRGSRVWGGVAGIGAAMLVARRGDGGLRRRWAAGGSCGILIFAHLCSTTLSGHLSLSLSPISDSSPSSSSTLSLILSSFLSTTITSSSP